MAFVFSGIFAGTAAAGALTSAAAIEAALAAGTITAVEAAAATAALGTTAAAGAGALGTAAATGEAAAGIGGMLEGGAGVGAITEGGIGALAPEVGGGFLTDAAATGGGDLALTQAATPGEYLLSGGGAETGGMTGEIVPAASQSAPTLANSAPLQTIGEGAGEVGGLGSNTGIMQTVGEGAGEVGGLGSGTQSAAGKTLGEKWAAMTLKEQMQTGMLGGSVALMGLGALTKKDDKKRAHAKPYNRQFDPSMGIYPSMSGQGLGFAKGGIASLPAPGMDAYAAKKVATIRQRYRSKADAIAELNDPNSVVVQAGINSADDPLLQQAFGYTSRQGKQVEKGPQYMAGGGMAGDGMSDSIPATIEGRAPARLAANEYVVPADVVSHLGNGSSDAGAQQMNSMVARIRKARTGTTKQAPKVSPKRFMPA